MTRRIVSPGILLICLFAPGCGGDTDPTGVSPNGDGQSSPAPARIEPVTVDPASIQVLDWQGVEDLVSQSPGKVVVLYLWATYNQHSLNEFPQFVRLCRKHQSDLRCVSLSLDYAEQAASPEELRDAIAGRLGDEGADFEHAICSVPAETLYEQLDMFGGIPVVYVYGRDGELAKRFDHEDAQEGEGYRFQQDVVPFVEELLAGPERPMIGFD